VLFALLLPVFLLQGCEDSEAEKRAKDEAARASEALLHQNMYARGLAERGCDFKSTTKAEILECWKAADTKFKGIPSAYTGPLPVGFTRSK